MTVELTLNGVPRRIECEPGDTLFALLRREGCFSVRYGSDTGETGAAAVLLDGRLVAADVLLAAQAGGHEVTTVESLNVATGELHPIQQAFVDTGALQSGYSAGALVLATMALLERRPDPSEPEIRDALSGILDRETGYVKVVEGVRRAAALLRGEHPAPLEPLIVERLVDRLVPASEPEAPVAANVPAAVPRLVPSPDVPATNVVGTSARKVDALRLAKGNAAFAGDVECRGLLHATRPAQPPCPRQDRRDRRLRRHGAARRAGRPPLREHAAGEVLLGRAELAEPVPVGPGELRRQGPPRRRPGRGGGGGDRRDRRGGLPPDQGDLRGPAGRARRAARRWPTERP